MSAAPHWHAYAYTGSRLSDGDARRPTAPGAYPPFLLSGQLRKPAKLIEATFTDVDLAVDWLRKTYDRFVPMDVEHFPIERRLALARETLKQEIGHDSVTAYYVAGGQWVHRALIGCPRYRADETNLPRCPQGMASPAATTPGGAPVRQ